MLQRLDVYMTDGWAMWVDIEGFSVFFDSPQEEPNQQSGRNVAGMQRDPIWLLHNLIQDLYRLGSRVFPNENGRLFIRQVGDGFIITSDHKGDDLSRPLAIGVALLRSALTRQTCLKIAIGQGSVPDISGCFPQEVLDAVDNGGRHRIPIGRGIMLLFPVMGPGLVDAHRTSELASGPLLLVKKSMAARLPNSGYCSEYACDHVKVDWLRAEAEEAKRIFERINSTERSDFIGLLTTYIEQNTLPQKWFNSANALINGY